MENEKEFFEKMNEEKEPIDPTSEPIHSELNEMSQAGEFDGLTVHVYGNEGHIPHFHIIEGNPKFPKREVCVKFNVAEYFIHGKKDGTLNSKEQKELVIFLKEMDPDSDSTYWKSMIFLWNKMNPGNKINKDMAIPDYSSLP